jgi:hypothetical protein
MSPEVSRIQNAVLMQRRPAGFGMSPARHLKSWVGESGFVEWIQDYLLTSCSPSPYELGPYSINSLQQTHSFSKEPSWVHEAGLFALGSSGNGDVLLCDGKRPQGTVRILSHDALWSIRSLDQINEASVLVAASLPTFFESCSSGEDLPGDFYKALKWKNEHQNHEH